MKRLIVAIGAAVVLLIPLLIFGLVMSMGGFVAQLSANAPPSQCITAPGELPATVPQPLNSIITAAVAEYKTDPRAVAAAYANENGSLTRDPAPPEGNGPPWPVSSANAVGPMQFKPSTFYDYRNANPAHKPGDINNLVDSVFAAAQYLSDLGATAGTPLGDPSNPQAKPTIINALARYHSGNFTSLGPAGRAYVVKGYATYQALASESPADLPASECFLPPGIAGDGYSNTDAMTCAAGSDMGVHKTAKGNNIRVCNVRGFVVNASISAQVEGLVAAAASDGFSLRGSGFRTLESQIDLRRAHCGSSQYDIWERPSRECNPETAIPGSSEHEQGLALDISGVSSPGNPVFRWLALMAAKFGLKNLPSEPWHWSTSGH